MSTEAAWKASCEKWRDRLWLNNNELFHAVMERKDREDGADGSVLAFVMADPAYRRITVTHDPEILAGESDASMDRHAAHEMTHAVLAPLKRFADGVMAQLSKAQRDALEEPLREANEAVTSHFTDILTRGPDWTAHDQRLDSCKHTEGC